MKTQRVCLTFWPEISSIHDSHDQTELSLGLEGVSQRHDESAVNSSQNPFLHHGTLWKHHIIGLLFYVFTLTSSTLWYWNTQQTSETMLKIWDWRSNIVYLQVYSIRSLKKSNTIHLQIIPSGSKYHLPLVISAGFLVFRISRSNLFHI